MQYYLDVYVPRPGAAELSHIDLGSGIVGVPAEDGEIAIFFEGNRYGSPAMKTFADRVSHAASRLRFDYPTSARVLVAEKNLIRIGHYDGVECRVELESEEAERELAAWLGAKSLDEVELRDSGAARS